MEGEGSRYVRKGGWEGKRRMEGVGGKVGEVSVEWLCCDFCTGNPVKSFGLNAEDLQEDFDPASYDATMCSVFGAEYYAEGEEEKPVFSDMEEELFGTLFALD